MPSPRKLFRHSLSCVLVIALMCLEYPVTISSWSSYLDVELNESVVFNCSATGSPSPSYWWTKDGGVQYEISSPEYVIPAVQDGDGGVYECLAYNARGNTTLQTVLRGLCCFVDILCLKS